MEQRLANKVVVVTGGSRGIGKAIVLAAVREGACVVVAARDEADLVKVVHKDIGRIDRQLSAMSIDVANEGQVKMLFEETMSCYGQVDVLVNAAGVYGPIGPTWLADPYDWLKAIRVNLFGTFMCCREALRYMVPAKEGRIINFSGGGATSPLPMFSAYGASKAAVVRLTETLAQELVPFNVQVNAIAPGMVDTDLQNLVLSAHEAAGPLYDKVKQMRETGQGGTPIESVAELVMRLAAGQLYGLSGKLVSVPHDGWRDWSKEDVDDMMSLPHLTLRRLDENTWSEWRPWLEE